MKKIFTLMILGLTAMAASAANFQLLFGDTPVTDGASYSTGYTLTTLTQGNVTAYTYKQNSDLYLTGSKGTPVSVTVSSDKNVSFCGFGTSCETVSPGSPVTKTFTLTGETESLEVDKVTNKFTSAKPQLDNINITVTVTSGSESVTVKVTMTNEEAAGVDNIVADHGFSIDFRNNVINYKAAQTADLIIYNVLGGRVMSVPVNGHGSVSLDKLSRGVYIYKLGRLTGKLVVR